MSTAGCQHAAPRPAKGLQQSISDSSHTTHLLRSSAQSLDRACTRRVTSAVPHGFHAEGKQHAGRRSRPSPSSAARSSRGLQEDHRRPRPTADVLRLPRRTLDSTRGPRTLSSRPSPPWGRGPRSPRHRLPHRGSVHGLQARRIRPATVAGRQRTPLRRPHPLRSPLRTGAPIRTASTPPDGPAEPGRCNTATAMER